MGKKQKLKANSAAGKAARKAAAKTPLLHTHPYWRRYQAFMGIQQQNNEVLEPQQAQTEEDAAQTQGTSEPAEHREIHEANSDGVESDAQPMYCQLADVRRKFVSDAEWSSRWTKFVSITKVMAESRGLEEMGKDWDRRSRIGMWSQMTVCHWDEPNRARSGAPP